MQAGLTGLDFVYDRGLDELKMAEPIICPLWVSNDDRFRSRRYNAWDRPCGLCGRKVVVSDAIRRQLQSHSGLVIVCEQCALAGFPENEALHRPESQAVDTEETCSTCASLKEQEEAAAVELARVRGLPDSADIQRKCEHLSRDRWEHRFKAHNREARGRE
jgi:hypothetical protein